MNQTLTLLLYMAVLTWIVVLIASMVRVKMWTPKGLMLAFGNRDNIPEAAGFAGRVDRTASNTFHNLVYFAVLALTAHAVGSDHGSVETGAQVFFWARVVFIPVYYAGIIFLRTAVWAVSVVGLVMMLTGTL